MKILLKNREISGIFAILKEYNLYLNEIRKNLAANPERSPLMHSYGYASAGDRPALFARLRPGLDPGVPLSFVPFMQYAGKRPDDLD